MSNCTFFRGKPFAPEINGVYPIDDCRAGGAALPLSLMQGDTVSVVNSTIAGEGDCLGAVLCEWDKANCDGSESITIQNNIFHGYQDYADSNDLSCLYYICNDDFRNVFWDYNVIHQVKIGDYMPPLGEHDIHADPLFVSNALENFNGHLRLNSPAIDMGLPVGSLNGLIPNHDLAGTPRPWGNGVDCGAYEFSVSERATLTGSIAWNEIPLCALALANGEYMFTCGNNLGTYELEVPLDNNGQITVFAFVDGFAPFKRVLEPQEALEFEIEMELAPPDSRIIEVTTQFDSGTTNPDWERISGTISWNGIPLCAMVLANGQHMFTCEPDGIYDLEVPLDENGAVTLFGFADGFQSFKETLYPY